MPRRVIGGPIQCYDRHFPEGARLLGLNGAEINRDRRLETYGGMAEQLP